MTKHQVNIGHSRRSRAAGFSLLSVLVAGAIIVVVAGGIISLGQRTGQVNRQAKNRMVATFLAREGIELVRVLRDNNWLATPRCLDTGPCDILWRSQVSQIRNGVHRIKPDPLELVAVAAGSDDTRLYQDGAAYRHAAGGTLTPFRRWITIEALRADGGHPEDYPVQGPADHPLLPDEDYDSVSRFIRPSPPPPPAPGNNEPRPFLVKVFVTWDPDPVGACDKGVLRSCIRVAEILYPWMNIRD